MLQFQISRLWSLMNALSFPTSICLNSPVLVTHARVIENLFVGKPTFITRLLKVPGLMADFLGLFYAVLSAIANGTFTVPSKLEPAKSSGVEPYIFNLYVGIGIGASSVVAPFIFNVEVSFTWMGLLSGLFLSISTTNAFQAVKFLGISAAAGIWCGVAVVVSFFFGYFFEEPVSNLLLALTAIFILVASIFGIAYAEKESSNSDSPKEVIRVTRFLQYVEFFFRCNRYQLLQAYVSRHFRYPFFRGNFYRHSGWTFWWAYSRARTLRSSGVDWCSFHILFWNRNSHFSSDRKSFAVRISASTSKISCSRSGALGFHRGTCLVDPKCCRDFSDRKTWIQHRLSNSPVRTICGWTLGHSSVWRNSRSFSEVLLDFWSRSCFGSSCFESFKVILVLMDIRTKV